MSPYVFLEDFLAEYYLSLAHCVGSRPRWNHSPSTMAVAFDHVPMRLCLSVVHLDWETRSEMSFFALEILQLFE